MNLHELKVKITLIDDILGTLPADSETYKKWVVKKYLEEAKDETELARRQAQVEKDADHIPDLDEEISNGMTVFAHDANGKPAILAYNIKGFFKSACKALRDVPDSKSKAFKNYKGRIDQNIFVYGTEDPEKTGNVIPLHLAEETDICERPLRAETMQGPRVALACSERNAKGAWMLVTVKTLTGDLLDLVREWLDYGELSGLGQWRSSGKGRFVWEEVKD